MDRDIPATAYMPGRLKKLVKEYAPKAVAFNGKRAAQIALGAKQPYGRLALHSFGNVTVWVLPSTSGAARGFFRIEPWCELAEWCKSRQ